MTGLLPLEEMSRQQIEQNVCCNLLYIQVVNLLKNSCYTKFASNFMDLEILKFQNFQNSKIQSFWDVLGVLIVF